MIEIYFDDLTKEKQTEILEALGDIGDFDKYPIATFEVVPDDVIEK